MALLRHIVLSLAVIVASVGPLRSQSSGFFFIQLSDPQFGMFTADRDFAQETANFEFAVAAINRLKPAFVVITGDLVNRPGDTVQIAEYDRIKARVAPAIPVYDMPGNHDVENAPTAESVAAYRARGGRDRYVFTHQDFTGVVLNSSLLHTPDKAPAEADAQLEWLRRTLPVVRSGGARHVVVFQHHPWFLVRSDEPDQYFNIPLVRRTPLLQLFRESGVRLLVAGHYHRNAVAVADGLEAVTTGPVGKPLGEARSGFRIFLATPMGITHAYYEFGRLPEAVDVSSGKLP
jgi:serine/threonine-protein phosphatase CPPED1